MTEWFLSVCLLAGGLIMLLGAIGVVRMPDLFTRMQTATKPAILGSGLLALAVTIRFADPLVALRAILISAFFFLTAPVAAHVIARAAYFAGTKLWEGTIRDELQGQYDPKSYRLKSSPGPGKN